MNKKGKISKKSKNLGKERKAIYNYLEEQGLIFTPQIHQDLKKLLIEYVNAKTKDLQERIQIISEHVK